jgi:enoyl-CoA hydratase/carnithine racemase
VGSASESAIRWDHDTDGIVTLTLDDPTQRVNTLNALFADSFAAALDRLETERDRVTGVIVRSAKSSFLAGGDLNRLAAIEPAGRADFLADLQLRKSRTRRLELLGRPVVAVLAGAALGGGLELALACHYRIAVDDPRVVVGLPEVTLGLLPGGGGVVRTVLGLGLDRALGLILSGARLDVAGAVDAGLIDATAADEDDALHRAREWIRAHPDVRQPWDADAAGAAPRAVGTAAPGGPGATVAGDPARRAVVEIAGRVVALPVGDALQLESEALADLVVSDTAKATMQVVFFDTVRVRSRLVRATSPRRPVLVSASRSEDARATLGAAARTLEPAVRVIDLAAEPHLAAEVETARADAAQVVLDVVDGPGRVVTDVALRIDRLGDGGLVLLHAAEQELADVLPAFSRAGTLPIAVRPGQLDLDVLAPDVGAGADVDAAAARLAAALPDALVHLADVDVASVRACGLPPWTGGAARYLDKVATPTGGAHG